MSNHDNEKHLQQFKEEYEDLFAYLNKFISFRVPHREDAEEIMQEVFLQGYAKLHTFNPQKGSMRQWFTGIAKYKIADYWRGIHPTAALEDALNVCCELDHCAINNAIDASVRYKEVLANLSPEARSLFTLRYVDGLTYEEIASYVGKKPSAIRTYFSRAFTRIRQSNTL